MANTVSARKRVRQAARRTLVNHSRLSRIRTFIKKVEAAITSGKKSEAETALRAAMPEIHRGAAKGYMHKNAAARKLSRLSARINALG